MKKKILRFLSILFILGSLSLTINNKSIKANTIKDRTMISVELYGNFTLTNSKGQTFKWNYNDMSHSGNMYVEKVRYGGPGPVILAFETEHDKSFTYKSSAKKSYFRILGKHYYARIQATNASSMTISYNNGVKTSITGKNMSYSTGFVARNNNKMGVELIGKKSNGTVSMEDSKKGIIVSGSSGITTFVRDDLKDRKYSVKTTKFIPYASPVTLTNIKGTAKVKNAKKISSKTYNNGRINLHAYQQQGTAIRLSWNPIKNAKGYIVYKYNPKTKKYYQKKIVKGQYMTLFVDRNLRVNTVNTYKVRPYYSKGKKGNSSYYVSAITKSSTRNNVTKIKPNKKIVKGRVGTKVKMNATVSTTSGMKVYNKSIRWFTNNSKIAYITKSGKLELRSKGKTYIWAKAHNGKNVRVNIVVK